MNQLPLIATRVLGTPLVIGQAKLESILSVLGPRIGVETPELAAMDGGARSRRSSLVTPDGIAVIPVFGTLVKRTGPIEAASGLTSYGDLETDILDAATDPAVRAILLDVDSPGGEASGVFDLADMVREVRDLKPVWAVANAEAFSGAYAIASAAERIFVPRTGGVGSIGVIALHVDRSVRDAMDGHRYTTVFAGARKNDLNPHEALGDEAKATLKNEVDRVYGLFVETVARNRSMSEQAVRATEAGVFFGEKAIEVGLADDLGTLRDALEQMAGVMSAYRQPRHTKASLSSHRQAGGSPASTTTPTPTANQEEPMSESITEAAPPKPDASAEIIDLEKLRAEARGEGATNATRDATAIADLCVLAGRPDLTAEMIARGVSVDEVRKALLSMKADNDGSEVSSHVLPGAGTGQPATIDDNIVVRTAKARAAKIQEN